LRNTGGVKRPQEPEAHHISSISLRTDRGIAFAQLENPIEELVAHWLFRICREPVLHKVVEDRYNCGPVTFHQTCKFVGHSPTSP
jgi:hypothetical protein